MRRWSALLLMLLCGVPGCVLGVGWLPDSSGFVFTTPQGDLVAYDYAKKKQRVILNDKAAATTAWPAVHPDGKKVALVHLGGQDDKNKAVLQIMVCDLQGKIEFRSDPLPFAKFKGKELQYTTQVVWSPDGKKLLVHGQGFANQGHGFDNAAIFDVAAKTTEIFPQQVPVYFGGTPVRPDGAGFLLLSMETKDGAGEYTWVDWAGKKQKIIMSKDRPDEEEEPQPFTALYNSRWDGGKAILTLPDYRHVIDTQKLAESFAKAPAADTKIGKETIQMRAPLASGVELFLLSHDDDDKSGPAVRLVARKKGEQALTEVIAPTRDRMILLQASPGGKRAIVRVGYGYRGVKGDTIYVLDEEGRLHDTVVVYEKK